MWTLGNPALDTEEPIDSYNLFWGANSALNWGFEHQEFQDLLALANAEQDGDARWALQAEIAKWMFDNVMLIPTFVQNGAWPLGPEIDEWELLFGGAVLLNNWENVPHAR